MTSHLIAAGNFMGPLVLASPSTRPARGGTRLAIVSGTDVL